MGERTESERREAPSGRARSATEVRAEGLVPSATMKDATHVMAGAVLSEPRTARDHESFHRATKAGSADGLRKRRTRRSRHFTGACSRSDENDTWDPRIRCSRRQ